MGMKSRGNFSTGLEECMNPAKCICIFCKAKRAEKEKQDEERRRPKE